MLNPEPRDFTVDGVLFTIHQAGRQLFDEDGRPEIAEVCDVAFAVYLSAGVRFTPVAREHVVALIRRPGGPGYGRFLRYLADGDQRQTGGRDAKLYEYDYVEDGGGAMCCPKCRRRYHEWRWLAGHLRDRHGLDAFTCEPAEPAGKEAASG